MAAKKIDFILLIVLSALLIFGILIIASVSASLSHERFGNTYYYLGHHLASIIAGLILGFLAFRANIDFFKKWAPVFLLGSLILMGMVFVPQLGIKAGGASRWLNLGFASFQPSELLKLTFIIYLASWLSARTFIKNKISKFSEKGISQTFIAFLVILGAIIFILLLQSDMSTLLIILAIAVILYFLAKTPLWHTVLLVSMGAGVSLFFAYFERYRFNRLLVFLKPETDPMGIGYQLKQALIAVGSGGIFGLGLGMSRQKFGFLPSSMTDSIFAILAEETGFLGCFILIFLFIIFLWRGFKIGRNNQDNFSKLVAFGITCWILIQSLINISSMVGLFPITGIPLPFFSYGGSAIIVELIGAGILLNISKKTTQ